MNILIVVFVFVIAAYIISKSLFKAQVKTVIKNSIAKAVTAINLVPQENPTLKNAAAFEACVNDLAKLGFISEGRYTVKEMPGVVIAGFINPKESLFASAYDHPAGLNWVEIKGEYTDGTVIYAGNAPSGGQFDPLEGYIKINDKTANAAALFERIKKEGKPLPLISVQSGEFKTNFEVGYTKFMEKFKQKKVSQAEVNAFAQKAQERASSPAAPGQAMPATQLTQSADEIIAQYQGKVPPLTSSDGSTKIIVLQVSGGHALNIWKKLRSAVNEIKAWPVIIDEGLEVNSKTAVEGIIQKSSSLDSDKWFEEKRAAAQESFAEFDQANRSKLTALNEFTAHYDLLKNNLKSEVLIALVPTLSSWEVPAYFDFGGWNENPEPALHVAAIKRWNERYGIELVSLSGNTLEFYVNRPPSDEKECLALAKIHYLYCPDRVEQGVETFQNLAAELCNGRAWYFWWD